MIDWEFILLELVIFLALYIFTSAAYFVCALVVDWTRLAIVYPPSKLQVTKKFGMRRIVIGKMGFPLGLDVKVDDAGLSFLIPWLFRFGFPAIFIPWKELKPIGRYKLWLKRIEFIVFSVKLPQETWLMIPSTMLYSIENSLPKNFTKNFNKLKWIIS
jgi:hypothetical protein